MAVCIELKCKKHPHYKGIHLPTADQTPDCARKALYDLMQMMPTNFFLGLMANRKEG